jgi:hypothetical protein
LGLLVISHSIMFFHIHLPHFAVNVTSQHNACPLLQS